MRRNLEKGSPSALESALRNLALRLLNALNSEDRV